MSVFIYSVYGSSPSSALLMIIRINPIHSVPFPIIVFGCAAVLFTTPHIDFIGPVSLMVYVGAIAVLSPFVVTMPDIKRIERDPTTYVPVGGFICMPLAMQSIYLFFSAGEMHSPEGGSICEASSFEAHVNADESRTKHFVAMAGIMLYTDFAVVLILSCLTLSMAPVGSICLTNTATGYSPRRQDNQVTRNNMVLNPHIQ